MEPKNWAAARVVLCCIYDKELVLLKPPPFSDHTCAQQESIKSCASAVYYYTRMNYAADGTGVPHQRGGRASEPRPPLQWVRHKRREKKAKEAVWLRAGKPPIHVGPSASPPDTLGGIALRRQSRPVWRDQGK